MKFYTMEHRGSLADALVTRKKITKDEFVKLLSLYKFYCYDERINCDRFILKNMEKNYKKYTIWLLKEYENNIYNII